ncbi:MAG TPA: SAM-dependent chlorinase/fluorinase [Mariprofundaceae bacterium]|nr:SAM-dependent chlorinase/fluorinase [Mariprofundaceae bacterium]
MIVLFTDFGLDDPYTGQMEGVLYAEAPGTPVVRLFSRVPDFNIHAGGYLLPAYSRGFPAGTVFLCVVDPGVGGARRPVALQADGCWFVGPDNGLFTMVARRGSRCEWWHITWRPERLSSSFHGRDLFAPVAARLARGEAPLGERFEPAACDMVTWPEELFEVVYIDHYGNAMTGLRGHALDCSERLVVKGRELVHAGTFQDVPTGEAFWYVNANGLVEIAANQASAAELLTLSVGSGFTCVTG